MSLKMFAATAKRSETVIAIVLRDGFLAIRRFCLPQSLINNLLLTRHSLLCNIGLCSTEAAFMAFPDECRSLQ